MTGTGTVAAPTGPLPASSPRWRRGLRDLHLDLPDDPGGALAFAGAAAATDSFSGTVSAPPPRQPRRGDGGEPGRLTASLPSSGAAAVGQEFTVAMTVTNAGGAAAT